MRSLAAQLSTHHQADGWHGVVVDPHWSASTEQYNQARPELYEQDWILLSMPLGEMLLSPGEMIASAIQGDIVVWENARLDLYAVV